MNQNKTKSFLLSSLALSVLLSGSMVYNTTNATASEQLKTKHPFEHQMLNTIGHSHAKDRDHFSELSQKHMPLFEEAASILGINSDALLKAMREGSSIMDIAKEKGISEQELTDKLMMIRTKKLDDAVKSGKLSEEKSIEIQKRMSDHLKLMLHRKMKRHVMGNLHHQLQTDPDRIAAVIGISSDELMQELRSGKSITEIAAEHGLSKKQLIVKMTEMISPLIEDLVDSKINKQ